MNAEPTERDHFPVDAAVGRYRSLCDAYVQALRRGDERAAEKALAKMEQARMGMVEVCRRFNAKWGKVQGCG